MKTIEEASKGLLENKGLIMSSIQQIAEMSFKSGVEFAQRWIPVEEELPKHLSMCLFKLNNGNICIGKCNYFEHGDSELVEMYGKGLSYICHSYRNWELHDFKWKNKYEVTHWRTIELK